MSNPAELIILAEDDRQSRLVRAWIRARMPEFPLRNIRDSPKSNGQGSGAQRVLAQYESEVKAYLTRHARKWLVVFLDADNLSVQERLNQLIRSLRESEDNRVRSCNVDAEQIARLIPKWSVETWILYLNGDNVDEDTPYKNRNGNWDQLIRPAAIRLNELTTTTDPLIDCIPSLHQGVNELCRLTLSD